jgi:hypothetical protein
MLLCDLDKRAHTKVGTEWYVYLRTRNFREFAIIIIIIIISWL